MRTATHVENTRVTVRSGRSVLPGDCNGNHRIDYQDLERFVTCAGGPTKDLPDVRCACADLDGDNDADLHDWRLLALQFEGAPFDLDGDGVDDQNDPCAGPSAGAMSLIQGCTNLDLAQMPQTLLQPTYDLIDFLHGVPLADEQLAPVSALLQSGHDKLQDAAALVRAGMICESLPTFDDAAGDLTIAAELIDEAARTAQSNLPAPGDQQGDVRDGDLHVAELEMFVQRGVDSFLQVEGLWSAVNRLCTGASRVRDRRGVIAEIVDTDRKFILEDGTVYQTAEPSVIEPDLFPGRGVVIDGIEFGDGTGVAGQVAQGDILADPDPAPLTCLRLRFFPVQRFFKPSVNELISHDPLGYELNGTYRVEKGMRFGVERTCPPVSVRPGEIFTRHSVKFVVTYTPTWTPGVPRTYSIALDLDESDMPVPLPPYTDPDYPAKLEVSFRSQHCRATLGEPDCFEEPSVIAVQEWPLNVFDRRGLCFASYASTEFDVNDFVLQDFRSTYVTGMALLAVWDDGTEPTFHAEGYSAQLLGGGFTTSFPQVVPVVGGQEFAIHNFDFYPIHGAVGLNGLFAAIASGMDHAAGLRWPHVRGVNNGRPFQYSCQVPHVTRDVVNFCAGTNAYYRLPFDQGDTFWDQGQGNLSDPGCSGDNCPTHANGYAYDMIAPCDSLLRAARGGRVFWVREDKQMQVNKWCCDDPICELCNTPCCSASADSCLHNELWIQHQDGSIGRYVHMPFIGVLPEEGDVVQRGEAVGTVGLTGNTSGPHLHFEERRGGSTHLALFEARNPFQPSEKLTCYEPTQGVPLRSDNHAP